MPKVVEKKPDTVLGADFGIPEESEISVKETDLSGKVAELDRRLMSLRGPLATIEEKFRNQQLLISQLTEDLERLNAKLPADTLDVPCKEVVHPALYAGLTAKEVFLAALQAAIQSTMSRNPTAFSENRPDLRRSAMKLVVSVARDAADIVCEVCPHVER